MKVCYTVTALAEIDEILSFIVANNRAAAAAVSEEIEKTVLRIVEHPQFARVVYKDEVRAVMVGSYSYRIFYVSTKGEIIIRNVRSTKRRRPWEG